jgi:hypothetical protein
MIFKRALSPEDIRPGSMFRRVHRNKTVETARVVAVTTDSFGIPHVRYEVRFEKGEHPLTYFEGPRMLAMRTFADTYREQIV